MTNDDVKKPRRRRLSFMTLLLSFMVGIMLALPFKVIHEESDQPLPSESRQELLNRMSKIEEENAQLRTELEQSRTSLSDLEETLLEGQETSAQLADTLTRYRILAGLDPVHGPGIRLTLSEQTEPLPQGAEIVNYLIHQEDLLNIVNELWLAGAEAIAIQSRGRMERLIMGSTIRCVGSLIDVNSTRMTPPFDIFAIGNPEELQNALTMPGGVLEPLRFYGIQTEIAALDDATLPAYGGSTLMEYARPLDENQQ